MKPWKRSYRNLNHIPGCVSEWLRRSNCCCKNDQGPESHLLRVGCYTGPSMKHRTSKQQTANTNCVYTAPFSSVNSKDLWLSSFAEKECFSNQLLLHPLVQKGSERQHWHSDYRCCFWLSTPAHLKKQARGGDFKMQLRRWIKIVYSFKKTAKPYF